MLKIKHTLLTSVALVAVTLGWIHLSGHKHPQQNTVQSNPDHINAVNQAKSERPESFPADEPASPGYDAGDQFFAIDVPVVMGNKIPSYSIQPGVDPSTLTVSDPPKPKNMNLRKAMPVSVVAPKNIQSKDFKYPYDDSNKAATSIIDSVDFDGNATLGGFYNIPADPHGASGPNHVVNVVNTSIQMFLKDGTLVLETSLKTFFNSLSPATNTFDPKVIYDQYEDRWVVVTLERTESPDTSFVFLAVSNTSDPTGTWNQISIDTKINIGGTDHWLDYPGFAIDEQAVYVTGNMFTFAGSFGGNRLVVVDKGVSGGFYSGGAAGVNIYDPIPGGSFEATHQPAHTFGTVPGNTGTWLVMYSGLSNGTEAYQIITVDDPLGAISFNAQFVFFGDVDNTAAALPEGPQAGGAADIDLSDRRTQNAVWRNNNLYVTTVTNPGSGADAGQTTAYWSQLNTTNPTIVSVDGGHIGAEDLFTNAYTGYAAIAVDGNDDLIIGFTATSSANFPGSYYVTRSAGDPAGTVSAVETIRPGLAAYERTFGSGRNRWGDYSSVSVDPVDSCFWVYNKHAITQGTAFGGEDGRWGTAHASVCTTDIPPTAVDDNETIDEDSGVNSFAVTNNDTDPDGGTLNINAVSNASNGTTGQSGNSATYEPDLNFCGSDSFTYTLNGGSTATVNVTVNCLNDNPIANNDNTSTNEETLVSVDVLDNDTDVDPGNTLSVTSCSNPSNGTVSQNGDNCDFTPALNFNGSGSFDYAISDGNGGTDSASVTVTVNAINDDPEASDDATSTNEDTLVSVAVLGNDSDVDSGDVLSVTSCEPASNGSVVRVGNSCEYTPDANFNGLDSFTYAISDGNGGNDSATVTVTVNAVNDDPVANDDATNTDEDILVSVAVLGNDNDVDSGDVLSVTSCSNPSNGTVSQNGNNCDFTPSLNFNGSGSFDYAISDGNGGTDTASVTVTVNAVNDNPVANDDATSTNENTLVSVAVLGNDIDVDSGDVLSVTSCETASNGSVVRVGNNCEYTPDANFNGQDTFTYAISDGNGGSDSATVTVTVNAVNNNPVANDDAASTDEDTLVSVAVLDNDSDVDNGDVLSVTLCSNPSNGTVSQNGNNCDFTPAVNFNGMGSFSYSITDGNGGSDSATVTVTVNAINDDPVANNDTIATNEDTVVSVPVLDNDTDVDTSDVLLVTSCSNATNGTVSQNGDDCEFTPTADFNGTGSFDYSISDGNGGTDSASVTVTVNAVNDEPSMAVNQAVYVALSDIGNPPAQNMACQFDFGPADEDLSQAVNDMLVQVQNNPNNILNSIDIDNSGAISYTFSGNAGVAEVTVMLQDDGGTAFSGDDTSVPYTFHVHVQDYVFRNGFESNVCQ